MIINFKKLFKSFAFALRGLKSALSEQTFQIFFLIAILIIILMFYFETSMAEKMFLIFAITLVMSLEIINSRIEKILNIFKSEYDERIRDIKDMSAGAVLLSCIGAAAIGILIFLF